VAGCERRVVDGIGAPGESVCVNELAVVFVAFDGMQPIDVVGPHEVFANAGALPRRWAGAPGTRCGWRRRRCRPGLG